MSTFSTRVRTAGLAFGLAVGTTVLAAAGAHAQGVTSGSLSFGGDDWIGGGQSYAYSTGNKDQLTVFRRSTGPGRGSTSVVMGAAATR
ncbi:hypothetical protein CFP65_5483 [Kitasatospora sp. MMS16-BH015]|uniref:hypothetical protein n=1 Tax=Kitasatospora sp. MMS16-BH015 TaxID=2018025 RepID=UPI000CA3BD1E|nr:hypothetical protein [Kitasatospora sp. MMS16-BH015]AUG80184.1 hypothetical protein CFP65_5483 [Kitasatospora sp. MMS16-BH015]